MIYQAEVYNNFLDSPFDKITEISFILFLFSIDSIYFLMDKLRNLQFLAAHIA